ncbi:hypothetical protein SAMN05444167_2119 [Terriglobus roseus]|uniref:Uncharacterized protein n=2 Tax=Terriglobus roseus TaxID=392734 RepID=A0A1G7KBE1_9BACT|nr:hypothetical protein SAMN05444167_2119 [Terriglobus roseus]
MQAVAQKGCLALTFEGEVQAGNSFRHALGPQQTFLLENIASGWIVRVLPGSGARGPHDFAELATPPYRSPNPLLISTDFSFRAQDAVAWNPREFHFFTSAQQMSIATKAYDATLKEPNRPAAGAALFPLLAEACTATLQILDARIAGGSADQGLMAATVAQHFSQTAHTVDTSAPPSKLGRILWMRFRVRVGDDQRRPTH